MAVKNKIRKEIRDWVIFFAILGFLYFTGLYTEVAGFAQRMILTTGLIQADVDETTSPVLNDFNFSVRSIETGNTHNFSEFEGKLVFLNLWATWCAPCRAEMPSIQSLYDEYQDEDIVFLMVSSESETEKIRKYIDRKEFSFPVYQLISPLPDQLYSSSIPTTYVIGPEGNILVTKTGMANYDTRKFKDFLDRHL